MQRKEIQHRLTFPVCTMRLKAVTLHVNRPFFTERDSGSGETSASTHSFPLGVDVRLAQVGVRVDSGQLDAVGLGDLQDLVMDADGGHALLVGLRQSGFELVVSSDQTLESGKKRGRKKANIYTNIL